MQKENQIHWFFGTLLMMIFLLISTFNAFALQTAGVIDYADESSVRGWAFNSSDPSSSVDVKVVITNQANGQVVAELTTTASGRREDLASQGTGTGNYGFEIPVSWDTYGDGAYLVEAYAGGQKLSGTKVHGVGALAGSNLRSLGVFRTTAYCPCRKCSGGWGGRTSTGTIATANRTISVDPRVIPYGSRIMIGGTIYTAEDCGGGVKGNHIDIFFNTHAETRAYGSQNIEVYLVQ
ncbi:3D domain-containing protein [Clostridium sp. Marseille-P2415]|uniref:3D domain-containing protein n=1 Tax=Clostridium sp. Marseille-P2415 TaxID=1805471 RepID=UPI0009889027|nr:3D domain-containing protein [Clostridium sp. Marseille-P2415]